MKDNTALLQAIAALDGAICAADIIASHYDAAGRELRNSRAELLAQLDPPYLVDERQWPMILRTQ